MLKSVRETCYGVRRRVEREKEREGGRERGDVKAIVVVSLEGG